MASILAVRHALRSDRVFHRWVLVLSLAAALGMLIAALAINARSALIVIRFPFGVDYGEGIVWQQMRNIMRGHGYAPLGVYPAIVYHYPPVFHLSVGLVAQLLGADELATGRAVSWIATLGTASLIGILATLLGRRGKDRLAGMVGGLLIGLLYLSCTPVIDWGPLMRVDMLAYFLGLSGLLCTLRAIDRPVALYAAAFCFTLALYTKQVSIAAPVAAFCGLIVVRPRLAWLLAAVTIAQSGLLLLGLSWVTGGNFLRHIILYNVNRVAPGALASLIAPLLQHLVYITLALAGLFVLLARVRDLWPARQNHAVAVAGATTMVAYFILKTLMLGMIMKSGAGLNYAIEWFCAMAILAGVIILPAAETAVMATRYGEVQPDKSPFVAATILLAIALQAQQLPRLLLTPENAKAGFARGKLFLDLIHLSAKPVISDEMTYLIRAGRSVDWEPAIAAELGATRRYDEAAFVHLIRQKRFGLFITQGDRGEAAFDNRYNPPVADAIEAAYPKKYRLGRFIIHAPVEGINCPACSVSPAAPPAAP